MKIEVLAQSGQPHLVYEGTYILNFLCWLKSEQNDIVWKGSFKTTKEQHKKNPEIIDKPKGEEFQTELYSDAEILRIHMGLSFKTMIK